MSSIHDNNDDVFIEIHYSNGTEMESLNFVFNAIGEDMFGVAKKVNDFIIEQFYDKDDNRLIKEGEED